MDITKTKTYKKYFDAYLNIIILKTVGIMEQYSITTNFGIIDKVECSEEEAIKQLKTIARRAKTTLFSLN